MNVIKALREALLDEYFAVHLEEDELGIYSFIGYGYDEISGEYENLYVYEVYHDNGDFYAYEVLAYDGYMNSIVGHINKKGWWV